MASGLDQKVHFYKDSPTAAILGKSVVKRADILGRFWYGNGSKKKGEKSATGLSIYKLGLKGKPGDSVKYKTKAGKTSTAKGGQVILTGKDENWTLFANGRKKVAMTELMTLMEEDIEKVV